MCGSQFSPSIVEALVFELGLSGLDLCASVHVAILLPRSYTFFSLDCARSKAYISAVPIGIRFPSSNWPLSETVGEKCPVQVVNKAVWAASTPVSSACAVGQGLTTCAVILLLCRFYPLFSLLDLKITVFSSFLNTYSRNISP